MPSVEPRHYVWKFVMHVHPADPTLLPDMTSDVFAYVGYAPSAGGKYGCGKFEVMVVLKLRRMASAVAAMLRWPEYYRVPCELELERFKGHGVRLYESMLGPGWVSRGVPPRVGSLSVRDRALGVRPVRYSTPRRREFEEE